MNFGTQCKCEFSVSIDFFIVMFVNRLFVFLKNLNKKIFYNFITLLEV
jgi:hypothetical protein